MAQRRCDSTVITRLYSCYHSRHALDDCSPMAVSPVVAGMSVKAIPSGVWLLGVVSLLMDVSSEIVNALLPLYLTSHLLVSTTAIGMIEGFAMATAATTRLFAGVISDRVRSRKWLVVLGYGLAAASKLLFPLAASVTAVAAAKFLDRVGKGIRSAPRDALVADLAPAHLRGAAFGVRKGLDTVGGFLGPLAAMALMLAMANDVTAVLWVAVIPAVVAVLLLIVGLREPRDVRAGTRVTPPSWHDAMRLTRRVWVAIAITSLLTLARFSEAFLILRAAQTGLAPATVPLVLVALHLAYGLASYPAGRISDRLGRTPVLAVGAAVLVAAHLLLATGPTVATLWTGVTLWGVHMGFTQGVQASLLADATPEHLRGSAFGVASVVSGAMAFVGNLLAGWLWQHYGAAFMFSFSAAVATAVTISLLRWPGRSASPAA